MKKLISLVLMALMIVTALCGCGAGETPSDNSSTPPVVKTDLEYVQEKGTLIVGMTDYAPMNYKEDGSDEWTGFDTEFALAFGEKLGVNVEFFELADWGAKVNELNTKNIDCVWNGMTITDELKEAMAISNPYVINAQVIVCKEANKDTYKDKASIENAKIAVEGGSAAEKLVTDLANVTPCQNMAATLLEVTSGTCDVAIIDITMAKAMLGEGTSYPNLVYTGSLSEEQYGVGFRTGSELCEKLNELMAEMKADGTLKALATKYDVALVD